MKWSEVKSYNIASKMLWKYKVAENGKTQVKYKYLKDEFKYRTWVNLLSCILS